MIQTLAQRLAGFERMGLDAALVLRFDRALSLVSPEEFIERILVGGLRAGAILVGANFRFGHRGAGDVRLLGEFGKRDGFDVEIVPPVEIGGTDCFQHGHTQRDRERQCGRRDSVAGAGVFADRRNSRRGGARTDDPLPYSEHGARAGTAAEAGRVCDRIRCGRETVFVGDERGDAAHV